MAQSLGPFRWTILEHQEAISRILDFTPCGLHPLPLTDCRVLDVSNVFDDVAAGTRQDSTNKLLTASWAMGACSPTRALVHHIPGERMHQAVDACQRTHGILHALFGLIWCLYQRRLLSDTKCVEISDPCCYSSGAGKDF